MRIILIALCLYLSACGGVAKRVDEARSIQHRSNYETTSFQAAGFPLYAALPAQLKADQNTLTIVIEGDGYAFVGRRVSGDPTPKNPVGLKIATQLKSNAIYLARPCQYIWSPLCQPRFWSTDRFAHDILRGYDDVLNEIKRRYGNDQTQFHLVGYSGGAYIALTMAAMRDDIAQITTIAGLLSPHDWTSYHKVTPLNLPYTAQDLFARSAATQFIHICGTQDKVLPCDLTQDILQKYDIMDKNHRLIKLTGLNHESIWQNALDYIY